MVQKNFVCKGDICYSKDKNTLQTCKDGYLVCENGVSAGVFAKLPEKYQDFPLLDYTGKLILPGFTDLHVHAPQYRFRALGMDLELLEWLDTHTFPQEAKYVDTDFARKNYARFVEEMRKGPNTRGCIFGTIHRQSTEVLMELLEEAGLCAMVGKVNMDRHSPDILRETTEESAAETVQWLADVADKFPHVKPILTPRFLPSCTDELLEKLAAVEGIQWIRLLYCYPETLTQETIDVMAKNEKICHYIDMPIQHGCDTVLKRMGRKSSQELIRQTVKKLRDAMPDIAIRTTLIVGFPGETEEEFADLQKFVEEMRFDRLGVFCYSQEEGTPAAKMENQIDDEVKEERQRIIMDIQKNIAASLCQQEVGKTLEVLVEGKLPEENVYCGRTRWDAPDIDGMVFFHAEEEAYSGDFVSVKIKEAGDYDLMGDVVYADEFTE